MLIVELWVATLAVVITGAFGAIVSWVQLYETVAEALPASSVVLTRSECAPSASCPVTYGLVQAVNVPLSSEQVVFPV
jgi:hypothetical protein